MSGFDYVAWSLLVAGAFALLLAIIGRFRGSSMQPPLKRQRDRLEHELGNQLALHHTSEAGKIEDAIARLDAFAARHPRIGSALSVLNRVHLVVGIFGMGFVAVAIWAGWLGTGGGKWSPFVFLLPFWLVGIVIDSIPADGRQLRGALVVLGLLVAFAAPLAVISRWVP